jgi:cytochrome P450
MSELDPIRHGQRTRNVGSGYTLSNVLRSEPYIDALISLMEKRFDELIAAQKPILLDHWFNFMAFDVLGEVTFSKQFGFLQEGRDIGGAVKNTGMLALYISVMGYLGWLHPFLLGNPIIGWLNLTPSQHIFDTATATVEKRKANPEIRKDMLEQWTETLERVGPEKMGQNEIMAAAMANLGAGADTVSSILQGFFYYLLRAPEHFERLRNEIDEAQRRGELSKVVSHAEAQKLPFLQACVSFLPKIVELCVS